MHVRRAHSERGFTALDVLLTVAVMGVLIALATPRLTQFATRAKRQEAIIGLSAIRRAQDVDWQENGHYTGSFKKIGFELEHSKGRGDYYVRGNYYTFRLSQPWGSKSYYCSATANIDEDQWPDILIVYHGSPVNPR